MSALINSQIDPIVALQSHHWHAQVASKGAALLELSYKNQPVVISPEITGFYSFAGALLAPWANRLANGQWSLSTQVFQNPINEVANKNANHGLVFDREFEITAQAQLPSNNEVTLKARLGQDPGYPFQIGFEVLYRLDENGLTSTITAQNHGDVRVPLCIGVHPYLDTDKDSEITINARQYYETDDKQLPTQLMPVSNLGVVAGQSLLVSETAFDTCFSALELGQNGEYVTALTRPAISATVELWQSEQFGCKMLYVARNVHNNKSGTAVAIEPQTGPANALATGESLVWLAPGESFTASWGIRIAEGRKND